MRIGSILLIGFFVCLPIYAEWNYEVVDRTDEFCWYTDMELDASQHASIAYVDGANTALKFVSGDGSNWMLETVDLGCVCRRERSDWRYFIRHRISPITISIRN